MKNKVIYKILTHPLFVFPLLLLMLMAGNGSVPLLDQDESAYALIASGMNETGDYLEQKALWTEIHRKPPLHTWLVAGSTRIFGNSEFWIRFSTSLFAWGTLLLIYLYGKVMYYERIAITAAIIAGTGFLLPIFGKIAFTDATLLFFQTWAAFSFMALMHWRKPIHTFTFWLAFGLGVLVKGPPIIIFTGAFAVLTLLLHPVRFRVLRLHPWFFMPLALLPLFYWGWRYWQVDDGETVQWMLNWYVFSRAKGGAAINNQVGWPGYYFLLFSFAFIPYFRYFLPGIWEGVKALFRRKRQPEFLMLALWMVAGWWVYELIPSKLPSYALASLPAIALLMAHEMIGLSDIKVFSTGLKTLSVIEIILNFGLCVLAYFFGKDYLEPNTLWLVLGIMALLPLASIISFVQQWRRHFTLSIYFHLIFVGAFWLLFTMFAYPRVGQYWGGYKEMAQMIDEKTKDSAAMISLEEMRSHPPSLPYYIRQISDKDTRILVNWYEAFTEYQKPEPFVGVVSEHSKDTISSFVQPEFEFIPSRHIERDSGAAGYYLFMNDAAKK